MIIPTIVEYTPRGMMTWDPFSRLLKERIIMLTSPVTDDVASIIQANLIYLE
ncbi:MAG: ATP-dependent Clp protease proteolytic subunit, partial [Candidatus Kapaibacterium sp.]